jgi:hypothetical protein
MRLEQRLEALVREQLWQRFLGRVPDSEWHRALAALADRQETPNRLAARLMEGEKLPNER